MAIGFIGLGVMGEPMCRNLATRQAAPVFGLDRDAAPLGRLAAHGVAAAEGVATLAAACDTVFLCLPSGRHVEAVCDGPDGLLVHLRPGQTLVDLGTSPVALARRMAAALADRGIRYADAPIARTRAAAEAGTLSIMVGADDATFAAIEPLLGCMASDISRCGPVGTGQIAKLMNNMVLIHTVIALSEALIVARAAGMDGETLFATLAKGSADSFALRNHGMKAILRDDFPTRAFSVEYARKDLGYALDLAAEHGLDLDFGSHAELVLDRTIAAGLGDRYWPVISRLVGNEASPKPEA